MNNKLSQKEVNEILTKLFYEDLNLKSNLKYVIKHCHDNFSHFGFIKLNIK